MFTNIYKLYVIAYTLLLPRPAESAAGPRLERFLDESPETVVDVSEYLSGKLS